MSKYKDADAIHEKYDRYANHNPFGRGHGKTLARFLDWIDQEPNADVVEVVYCEDCKHKEYCSQNIAKFSKGYDMYEAIHYCSYGERSKDDE